MNRYVLLLSLLTVLGSLSPANAQTLDAEASACWRLRGKVFSARWASAPSLVCADCQLQSRVYSPTFAEARVRIPTAFLSSVDGLWLSSGEGTRIQLWPLAYYTGGPVHFETEDDLTFLVFSDAQRGTSLTRLTLEARQKGCTVEVQGVQRKRDSLLFPMPGSSNCPSCSVGGFDGATRIRLPAAVLRNALSVRLVPASYGFSTAGLNDAEEIPVWPPTATWLAATSMVGNDGEPVVELLIDDPSGAGQLVVKDASGRQLLLVPN